MASTDDNPNPLDRLVLDADGNGQRTSAELGDLLSNAFFLPGDELIWAVSTYLPPVAGLLGISPADYGGLLSGFVSTCVWIAAFIGVSIAYQAVRDFDRRLTGATRQLVSTAKLRVRITRAVLLQRWRAWRASRVPVNRVDFPGEIELSPTQLKALRLHAELPPAHALAVSETARALGARKNATQDLLDELKELGLLNRTIGGADGESAYTLSAAGKALLLFRQLNNGNRSTA